ncbi:hypothetical protein JCM10207_004111 [Rhodosporidiobolus poonsookiae]
MVQLLSLAASFLALAASSHVVYAEPEPQAGVVHTNHAFEGFGALGRLGLALEAGVPPAHRRQKRHAVELEERALNPKVRAVVNGAYTAVVAVGASYTDNGHARDAKYAGSLRDYYPYNKYGGKYTNGQVAVEYMVQSTLSPALKYQAGGIKLVDYAYGGSVIQNGLAGTSSSWPAAKDQVATYLADLESGAAAVGAGRVLHYYNSGINPVVQIWLNAVNNGMSSAAQLTAKKAITSNTQAMAAAIRSVNTDATVAAKIKGQDFLIAGIPQMDLVPTVGYQVPGSVSAAKRAQAIKLMQTLSNQFNSEMAAFAGALKKEVKNGGRVFWFDMAALWKQLHSSPKSFGITVSPATTSCYNSSTGGVCSNPAAYLYWDTLHPTTSVHKLMAQKMNALVRGTA